MFFGNCFNSSVGQDDILNICNIPVPVKDLVIPTYKLPSMVACYRLEASLVFNLSQVKHVLLTATEQEHCTSPLLHYNVRSPVYSMTSSK